MKQLPLIVILLFCGPLKAQSIYKSSIDSGGASASNGNIQLLYTIGEVNVREASAGNIVLSEGFIGRAFSITIDPKVFLQGPFLNPSTPGLMNDGLRNGSYLPTTSPYSDGAVAAASVFNDGGTSGSGLAQDNIVDWVWVELRDQNSNTTVLASKSALLQRDGDIVDVDGLSNISFNVGQNNYYVVVKHRNHLGIMSSVALNLLEGSTSTVDFRTNALATFGSNARVDMGSGNWAMWAGDTDGTGKVRFSGASNGANVIKDHILADPSNVLNFITFASSGYLDIDVDMNGTGKFSGSSNDSNILKDNVLAFPGNVLNFITYTITTTVPE